LVFDDDKINRLFQPYLSLPLQRIDALKKLKAAGVKNYVHLGPIMPKITDMESIFQKLSDNIDSIMAETLNVKGENWIGVFRALKEHFSELVKEYQYIFFKKDNFGEQKATLNKLRNI